MTHPQHHCGANAVAAIRLALDGRSDESGQLLLDLDDITARHALLAAVEVATDLAACLNQRDHDHGDWHLTHHGLGYATAGRTR